MYQFDWSVVWKNLGALLDGLRVTIVLAVLAMSLSLVGGLMLALIRRSPATVVRSAVSAYVEFFRTTPFLIQLFWIFYGLPVVFHISFSPFISGLLALSLNVSAYNAEIFRAGIESIGRGQVRAGLALGMTRTQVMRRIVLPQAVRRVIPPLGSQWVSMFKDTSLVSFVNVADLTYRGLLIRANTYKDLEILTALALIYLIVGYPQAKIVDWLYRGFRTQEI
jgi:His/Glu/Gln/Arg/opine family amino acid ABC transporter permease subunit